MKKYIIGISAYYHDSSVSILKDGSCIFASQEERFTGLKNDPSFPGNALSYAIDNFQIRSDEIESVVFYEKPFWKIERAFDSICSSTPFSFRFFLLFVDGFLSKGIFLKRRILKEVAKCFGHKVSLRSRVFFSSHHLSHAASAFYPSTYDEAAIICIDGVGEWASLTLWKGEGKSIELVSQNNFPHSLGLLYSAFTSYLGFSVNSGEYKVMGMAAYGKPIYLDLIESEMVKVSDDALLTINVKYFPFHGGGKMYSQKFTDVLGHPPREPGSNIDDFHYDLAASIQAFVESYLLKLATFAKRMTGSANLCMAGGVALNCKANSELVRSKIFDRIWVQPAAGDAGGSLGAALLYYNSYSRSSDSTVDAPLQFNVFLGASYNDKSIEDCLIEKGVSFKFIGRQGAIEECARLLEKGEVVGWFQGRSEFGPRALGNRSILANPAVENMKDKLNLIIKKREPFRPFGAAFLEEEQPKYFDGSFYDPFMTFLQSSNSRNPLIDSIYHADQSCRVQTVSEKQGVFYSLINLFYEISGVPCLINTSFNVRGKPIVNSPDQAVDQARECGLRYVFIEGFMVVL